MPSKYSRNENIADFSEVNNILSNDSLLISREIHDVLSSYIANFNLLSSIISSNFSNISSFEINGEWKFNNIHVNEITTLSSVVNYKYLYEKCIKKINELSVKLYGDKPKIPSYPGEIIISNTLSSEKMVKEIYGGEKWSQLKGRFLLGTGENAPNTKTSYGQSSGNDISYITYGKMGGATAITLKSVPSHTHVFGGETYMRPSLRSGVKTTQLNKKNKFTMYKDFTVKISDSSGAEEYICAHKTNLSCNYKRDGDFKTLLAGPNGQKINSETDTKDFSFTIKGSVTDNKSNNNPINIMPQYISEYIWIREK